MYCFSLCRIGIMIGYCFRLSLFKRLICPSALEKQFFLFYTVFLNRPEAIVCVSALYEK